MYEILAVYFLATCLLASANLYVYSTMRLVTKAPEIVKLSEHEAEIASFLALNSQCSTEEILDLVDCKIQRVIDELEMYQEPYGHGFINGDGPRTHKKMRQYSGHSQANLMDKLHTWQDFRINYRIATADRELAKLKRGYKPCYV